MQMFINGNPIDFTVENEKTVGEIIDGCAGWLGEGRLIINSVAVDGKEYPYSPPKGGSEWRSMPIDGVNALSLKAESVQERDLRDLETLVDFYSLFRDALKLENRSVIADVLNEAGHTKSTVGHFAPEWDYALFERQTEPLGLYKEGREPEPEQLRTVIGRIEALIDICYGRIVELIDPRSYIREKDAQWEELQGRIPDISVLMQNGNDSEALAMINHFIGYYQLLIRLYYRNSAVRIPEEKKETFTLLCNEINPSLSELEEAIRLRDTVLISDLMEYEMPSAINRLRELFAEYED